MSYPRRLWILIVEDDGEVEQDYRDFLTEVRSTYKVADVEVVRSFEEARRVLGEDRIFHLVIIDLRIPVRDGQPPREDARHGQDVVHLCAAREQLPVPAVLVVSAVLGSTRNREALRQLMSRSFAHGSVVVKGNHEAEIRSALRHVLAYLDRGITIRESDRPVFAPLTPREEDLLRRMLIKTRQVGVDLAWWSCSRSTSQGGTPGPWTKVLYGSALDRGGMRTRAWFFKFFSAADSPYVFSAARAAANRLSHVKVHYDGVAGERALLVTEQVGKGRLPPLSLRTLLAQGAETTQLERMASSILSQLNTLGQPRKENLKPADLLWKWHDFRRLRDVWNTYADQGVASANGSRTAREKRWEEIVATVDRIRAKDERHLVEVHRPAHGDLHNENVIVDEAGEVYLIDIMGREAPVLKDPAILEVSCILHRALNVDSSASLVELTGLFRRLDATPADTDPTTKHGDALTFLICALREGLNLGEASRGPIYALLLFDAALMQLGTLGWQPNRIAAPREAPQLVSLLADLVGKYW